MARDPRDLITTGGTTYCNCCGEALVVRDWHRILKYGVTHDGCCPACNAPVPGRFEEFRGHPHTDQMHVVERFTRPNKATLHYEALIDDPGAYTKPFTVAWDIPWRANGELTEYICQENNKYLQRLTDDFGQPLFGSKK